MMWNLRNITTTTTLLTVKASKPTGCFLQLSPKGLKKKELQLMPATQAMCDQPLQVTWAMEGMNHQIRVPLPRFGWQPQQKLQVLQENILNISRKDFASLALIAMK